MLLESLSNRRCQWSFKSYMRSVVSMTMNGTLNELVAYIATFRLGKVVHPDLDAWIERNRPPPTGPWQQRGIRRRRRRGLLSDGDARISQRDQDAERGHAPALLDIGVIRQPSELSRALLEPEADINTDFRTVRITTKSGATITGRLLNQSSYSVQILDTADRLRSFDKAGLREVIVLPTSPMPSYASTFSPQETADMVAFLSTMRGSR